MTVDDELWDEFHRVVNMSSRELSEWLRTRDAEPEGEALPDQAGTPTGREVLHILGKRRTDLQSDDVRVMERVVRQVRAATTSSPQPGRPRGATG